MQAVASLIRVLGVAFFTALGGLLVAAWWIDPVPCPDPPTDLSEMVHVDAGKFSVGGIWKTTDGFWIDRFEVTEREWRAYFLSRAAAGRERAHLPPASSRPASAPIDDDSSDDPHRMVTWSEARDFAAAYFKRLPTNLEWERASHGPGDSEMPWGSGVLEDAANTAEAWTTGRPDVVRVGTFEAGKSMVGAYDMIGNVWEWTSSDPTECLHLAPPSDDPDGVWHMSKITGDRYAVLRGGGFSTSLVRGEPGLEKIESIGTASFDLGFRCVIDDAEVEFQKELHGHLRALGFGDPLRVLWYTRTAEQAIRSLGDRARPYLSRVLETAPKSVLTDRIRNLLKTDAGHE